MLHAGAAQTLSVTFTPSDTDQLHDGDGERGDHRAEGDAGDQLAGAGGHHLRHGLGTTQLNASTLVAGTFSYTPAAGTVLSAGAGRPCRSTFTPTDAANYTTATASVTLTVLKATPAIALTGGPFDYDANAAPGDSAATGIGGAPVAGTFGLTYTPGGSAPPVIAGSYEVTATFTSTDPNYSDGSASTTITIDRAVPESRLAEAPAAIVYGTALGAAQLNMIAALRARTCTCRRPDRSCRRRPVMCSSRRSRRPTRITSRLRKRS